MSFIDYIKAALVVVISSLTISCDMKQEEISFDGEKSFYAEFFQHASLPESNSKIRGVKFDSGHIYEMHGCSGLGSLRERDLGKYTLGMDSNRHRTIVALENGGEAFLLISSPNGTYHTLYRKGFGHYTRYSEIESGGVIGIEDVYHFDASVDLKLKELCETGIYDHSKPQISEN